jgi:exopolysaccharide biosynthesis WecB/TagA/CpsF family protein
MNSKDIFSKITPLRTYEELFKMLDERPSHRPFTVDFCNAHAVNLAHRDERFCAALLATDLLLRDGMGMKIAMRLLSYPPALNANGTDGIPLILKEFQGRRIVLFGTREPWLSAAAAAVGALGLTVCDRIDGFQPSEAYLRSVAATRPDLVLLGMGMPRQEEISALIKEKLGEPLLILCGGAILDFLGGRFPRAPHWMRRCGMEWVFRLALEPRRLWQRYILGNGQFLARVLALKLESRTSSPARQTFPGRHSPRFK